MQRADPDELGKLAIFAVLPVAKESAIAQLWEPLK